MKTAFEIIEMIEETTRVKSEILAALEDGAALAALGVTDEDQEAVEEAHDIIKPRA